MCEKLGVDGGHLPDDHFFDPSMGFTSTPATDIFSLGSIFYTLCTGHWPHKPDVQGKWSAAGTNVNELFKAGVYPSVTAIQGGSVILGCWKKQYNTATELLEAVRRDMG